MGWNPKLIFYVCVAKGPTILAEFTSEGEYSGGVEEALARSCIERAPPNHLFYSQTVRKRSYIYLIDDPFVYFVISHEDLGVVDVLRFMDKVKRGFRNGVFGVEDICEVNELCLQGKMGSLFRDVLGFGSFDGDEEMGSWCLSVSGEEEEEEEDRGRSKVGSLMLVKPSKVLVKKKKRFFSGDVNGDHHFKGGSGGGNEGLSNVGENGIVVSVREFSVSMVHKGVGVCGGGAYLGEGRQKAKKIWKKHVWVVLGLDLFVCAVLFAIWLCVCRGFKCIDG